MKPKNSRKPVIFSNQIIYEWQESLESILLYVQTPPIPEGLKISHVLNVTIKSNSVIIGIKGNPPYLSHQTEGVIDSQQSVWYVQDKQDDKSQNKKKQIVIQLHKAQKASQWGCVFKVHKELNPLDQQELKKKLMKQRFEQEHPGFDFSDAEFNGKVPQARDFMGGVKYN